MLQVFLSSPETQTHERIEIDAMKEWDNFKHENSDFFWLCFISYLVVDSVGHRAAHLSLKPIFEHSFPDECGRMPVTPPKIVPEKLHKPDPSQRFGGCKDAPHSRPGLKHILESQMWQLTRDKVFSSHQHALWGVRVTTEISSHTHSWRCRSENCGPRPIPNKEEISTNLLILLNRDVSHSAASLSSGLPSPPPSSSRLEGGSGTWPWGTARSWSRGRSQPHSDADSCFEINTVVKVQIRAVQDNFQKWETCMT